jgi:hypothetical protein
VTDAADEDKLPKYDPLPLRKRSDYDLRSAKGCALKSLKFLGAWLKKAGASPAELDAMRNAYRALGGQP